MHRTSKLILEESCVQDHLFLCGPLFLPIAFSLVASNQMKNLNLLYLKNHGYKIIHFSVRGLLFLPIAFSLVASNEKKKLNLLDFRND